MGVSGMRLARLLSFCAALLPPASGPALANSELISPNPTTGGRTVVGGSFVLQGDCARNGIDTFRPGIDLKRSTWACTGASSQMLQIYYADGPQECVYIDNFNYDRGQYRAFFVPLQTSDEWIAFRQNRPGGVRLRFGCAGVIGADPCGNEFGLPDAPASDEEGDAVRVTTGDWRAVYKCPYTLDDDRKLDGGCGEWVKVSETGACEPGLAVRVEPVADIAESNDATTQILPVGPPGPDIPLVDAPLEDQPGTEFQGSAFH